MAAIELTRDTEPPGASVAAGAEIPALAPDVQGPTTSEIPAGAGRMRLAAAAIAAIGLHATLLCAFIWLGQSDNIGAGGTTLEGISVDVVSADAIAARASVPAPASASAAPVAVDDGSSAASAASVDAKPAPEKPIEKNAPPPEAQPVPEPEPRADTPATSLAAPADPDPPPADAITLPSSPPTPLADRMSPPPTDPAPLPDPAPPEVPRARLADRLPDAPPVPDPPEARREPVVESPQPVPAVSAAPSAPDGGAAASAAMPSASPPTSSAAAASPGEIADYARRVQLAIARAPPKGIGLSGTVVVRLVVRPDGSDGVIEIARGSGLSRLDAAALEAARRARLPTPPRGATADQLTFMIPYRFR